MIDRWIRQARGLPRGPKTVFGAFLCLMIGTAFLLIGSRLIDTSQPHLWGPLNDQIAYTNTARSLVTTGRLESYTILPSTLWQKKTSDFLYMPGHPVTIAASYKLFGVGAFQSILPSLISYLVAMLSVYLIGARYYSPGCGLLAAVLFALFPPILFLSFTAMAELTFLAAFTAATCAWIYLPRQLKPWLGPLCVAVPFLFRETAAFAAPALGVYLWLEKPRKLWRAVAFVALSAVLLVVIYRADFSANRPSLLQANIFGDRHTVYDDAQAQQAIAHPGFQDWLGVIPKRSLQNIESLFYNRDFSPWAVGENYIVIGTMILVGLIALIHKDKLALSFSALNVIALTAAVLLVNVSGYRGVRYLMFTYALNIIVIAPPALRLASDFHKHLRTAGVAVASAAVSIFTLEIVRTLYNHLESRHVINRGDIAGFAILFYVLTAAIIGLLVWHRHRAKTAGPQALSESRSRFGYTPTALLIIGMAFVLVTGVGDYPSKAYLFLAYAMTFFFTAWLLGKLGRAVSSRQPLIMSASFLVGTFCLFSLAVVRNTYTFFADHDATDVSYASALEAVGHDNKRMLVTPFDISIRYRYDHFPVPWSFTPYNQPTLELLAARFDIGSMVVNDDDSLLRNEADLVNLGFYKDRVLVIGEHKYVVYKRSVR